MGRAVAASASVEVEKPGAIDLLAGILRNIFDGFARSDVAAVWLKRSAGVLLAQKKHPELRRLGPAEKNVL